MSEDNFWVSYKAHHYTDDKGKNIYSLFYLNLDNISAIELVPSDRCRITLFFGKKPIESAAFEADKIHIQCLSFADAEHDRYKGIYYTIKRMLKEKNRWDDEFGNEFEREIEKLTIKYIEQNAEKKEIRQPEQLAEKKTELKINPETDQPTETEEPVELPTTEDGWANYNTKKPIRTIKYADLNEIPGSKKKHARECPVCLFGVLPVRRNVDTMKPESTDRCLLCGQRYQYLDYNIIKDEI